MQSGKTRTWANDDTMAQQASAEQSAMAINPTPQANTVEESASQPKKPRTQETLPAASNEEPQPMAVDHSPATKDDDKDKKDSQDEEEAGPVSDMDWLRSKTSRLLGLLDEDEQAEFEDRKVEQEDKPMKSQSPIDDEPRSAEAEPTSPQPVTNDVVDDAADEAADSSEEDQVSPEQARNIELIKDSARLFLRNLAYDLKEADLQPLFAPFGKTEEVSTPFFLLPKPPTHPLSWTGLCYDSIGRLDSHDDYPDRDI